MKSYDERFHLCKHSRGIYIGSTSLLSLLLFQPNCGKAFMDQYRPECLAGEKLTGKNKTSQEVLNRKLNFEVTLSLSVPLSPYIRVCVFLFLIGIIKPLLQLNSLQKVLAKYLFHNKHLLKSITYEKNRSFSWKSKIHLYVQLFLKSLVRRYHFIHH